MTGRQLVNILMIGGLLPFAALFFASLFEIQLFAKTAGAAYLAYGAIIASFLGGIHWGYAILLIKSTQNAGESGSESLARGFLALSNIVALSAWASLLFHSQLIALLVQISSFILALGSDSRAYRLNLIPKWFWDLRRIISVVVVSLHLLLCGRLLF